MNDFNSVSEPKFTTGVSGTSANFLFVQDLPINFIKGYYYALISEKIQDENNFVVYTSNPPQYPGRLVYTFVELGKKPDLSKLVEHQEVVGIFKVSDFKKLKKITRKKVVKSEYDEFAGYEVDQDDVKFRKELGQLKRRIDKEVDKRAKKEKRKKK